MIKVEKRILETKTEKHFIVSNELIEILNRFSDFNCMNYDASYPCIECPFNGIFESDFKDTNGIRECCLVMYMAELSDRLHPERTDE